MQELYKDSFHAWKHARGKARGKRKETEKAAGDATDTVDFDPLGAQDNVNVSQNRVMNSNSHNFTVPPISSIISTISLFRYPHAKKRNSSCN